MNEATGPGAITPDGCAVELYKILAPSGEAELIAGALMPEAEVLELGAGVGRVTRGLVARGHAVTAVDFSAEMLAEIRDATTVLADIADLDLGRRFAGVVLGSCLFNVADVGVRRAFLATCARHVDVDGLVLIECHTTSLLERARPGLVHVDANGVRISWLDVVRYDRSLTGTLEYRSGARVWTQTFTTEILDAAEIGAELERCDLRFARSLTEHWFVATAR